MSLGILSRRAAVFGPKLKAFVCNSRLSGENINRISTRNMCKCQLSYLFDFSLVGYFRVDSQCTLHSSFYVQEKTFRSRLYLFNLVDECLKLLVKTTWR